MIAYAQRKGFCGNTEKHSNNSGFKPVVDKKGDRGMTKQDAFKLVFQIEKNVQQIHDRNQDKFDSVDIARLGNIDRLCAKLRGFLQMN